MLILSKHSVVFNKAVINTFVNGFLFSKHMSVSLLGKCCLLKNSFTSHFSVALVKFVQTYSTIKCMFLDSLLSSISYLPLYQHYINYFSITNVIFPCDVHNEFLN